MSKNNPMGKCCPLCKLPRGAAIGRLVAFRDHADQAFVFELCPSCSVRLDRLPGRQQCRQLNSAVSNLERHPERYSIKHFPDDCSARLFVQLEAARLRGDL